ncbi:ribonuclease III [Eubacteriales bacterium OttesenSCG-928-K08]|nr:ribonuclease III [Eubacteriales bacterium OttesenSCG-928-K08]
MSICEQIRALIPEHAPRDAGLSSPLVLAYMGDTVYDLYVRTVLLHQSDATAHGFHIKASRFVCAQAQAQASERVLPLLSEQELSVFKRGRNAHMGTTAKNATIAQYRAATGLEALVGYLYLKNDDARLNEIMKAALNDITLNTL